MNASSTTIPPLQKKLISDEVTDRIVWILVVVVTPSISILGIVGNIFSLIIISKHGLSKSSNILLFSLAIADVTSLIGMNNIASLFYDYGSIVGFRMSYNAAYFMYILYSILNTMDYGSGSTAMTLPLLVTIERMIAVFFPLKFNILVTPKRVTRVIILVFALCYFLPLYSRPWFKFTYTNRNPQNISVGLIERTDFFYSQLQVSKVLQQTTAICIFNIVCPLVVLGCFVIGIKVKLTSIKRLKMTSSLNRKNNTINQNDSKNHANSGKVSRTTKTLVSVCVVYCITASLMSIPQFAPNYLSYDLFNEKPTNIGRVTYRILNIFMCLNSSCNFLIYVITNNKFRQTQKEILASCFRCKQTGTT